MGMSQAADICRISQSSEMSQWDIGGNYSRPICRRVLEERGVARELFGREKTGASVRFVIGEDLWSSRGQMAFVRWILTSRLIGHRRWPSRAWLAIVVALSRFSLVCRQLTGPRFWIIIDKASARMFRYVHDCGAKDYAFVWGIDAMRRFYRLATEKQTSDKQMSQRSTHRSI
jgi:hypothetical protein